MGTQVIKSRVSAEMGHRKHLHTRMAWCEDQSSGRMKTPQQRMRGRIPKPKLGDDNLYEKTAWCGGSELEQVRKLTIHRGPAQHRVLDSKRIKEDIFIREGQHQ